MIRLMLILMILLVAGCDTAEQTATVSLDSGNLMLDVSHGGDGSAWGLAECQGCHVLELIHQQADAIREIVRSHGYPSCTGCHGSNGTDEPRRCTICHNSSDLSASPRLDGIHSHNFTPTATGGLGDEQCLVCHQASDMNGDFDVNLDLTRLADAQLIYPPYTSVSEFCTRCHNRDHQLPGYEINVEYDDPLVAMEDNFLYVDRHGMNEGSGERTYAGLRSNYSYRSIVECTDCHAMHGTDNTGLVIDNSLKGLSRLDPLLRNAPYIVDIDGGNSAQLCVMCHSMTVELDDGGVDTGNGLAGVHEVGVDCLPCHSHGEAVQAGM